MKNPLFWRRNLTARLICTFLIFSLLIVSLVGSIAYYQTTRSLTRSVDDRLDGLAFTTPVMDVCRVRGGTTQTLWACDTSSIMTVITHPSACY